MSDSVFGRAYSEAYDRMYLHKDYDLECQFVRTALRQFGQREPRSIVDFGCGTGGHAIIWARDGLEVVGVDESPSMLEIARAKSAAAASCMTRDIHYTLGDIAEVRLGRQFDAVVMMFAVLGYQTTNEQLSKTLENAHRHLIAGGIVIADFWYGPAVLATKPGDRIRIADHESGKIIRTAQTELDTRRHLAHVLYNLWSIEGDKVVSQSSERHTMRFLFPEEIAFHLKIAHFELLSICTFPDFDAPLSDETWNAALIARAL